MISVRNKSCEVDLAYGPMKLFTNVNCFLAFLLNTTRRISMAMRSAE